jgi:predicted transposase YbfD/YdcC
MDPSVQMAQHFASLTDPRVERTREHELLDIVTIAICAVICSAETWVDLEEYGKSKETWLRTFLRLPHGIPSHDTFQRVLSRLDPQEFQHCFLNWISALGRATAGEVIALDGKTLRRAYEWAGGKAALKMVSAWATENHLVLGQVAVEEGSNEITAIPKLLKLIEIEGAIVTLDAMGTQKEIAATIREEGADYVLALKANQRRLHRAVVECFVSEAEWVEEQEVWEAEHGRIERRSYRSLPVPPELDRDGEWKDLCSIGEVIRERYRPGSGTPVSREVRYYLSSLESDVSRLAHAVRSHWGIENNLHWVLDVAFREDESRIHQGYGAENFALLRRIALSLLKKEKTSKRGIASKRRKAGWDNDYLLQVLLTPLEK